MRRGGHCKVQTEVLEAHCGVSWELALELDMAANSLTQSLSLLSLLWRPKAELHLTHHLVLFYDRVLSALR